MSYTSKFTERFDIDPSDALIQGIIAPPSPKPSSMYSTPDLIISNSSLQSHVSTITSTVKPIAIPSQNKAKNIAVATPPNSPPQNTEKQPYDALASKFKNFFSTISKKRNRSASVSSFVAISTK